MEYGNPLWPKQTGHRPVSERGFLLLDCDLSMVEHLCWAHKQELNWMMVLSTPSVHQPVPWLQRKEMLEIAGMLGWHSRPVLWRWLTSEFLKEGFPTGESSDLLSSPMQDAYVTREDTECRVAKWEGKCPTIALTWNFFKNYKWLFLFLKKINKSKFMWPNSLEMY